METPRDNDQLAADLRALRPTPRPEFAAELDQRAAAGFPRRTRLRLPSLHRLHAIEPRRLLLPAGGLAIVAIAVATAVIATGNRSDGRLDMAVAPKHETTERTHPPSNFEKAVPVAPDAERLSGVERSSGAAGMGEQSAAAVIPRALGYNAGGRYSRGSVRLQSRAVERSAELALAAAPGDVGDDSAKVFEAVHAHEGIVMSSSTREGKPGEAAARFELLIPSTKLGDALAALSAIDEVRSRHEATDDITAPTVATGELLQDSQARIDSLLAQLEGAEAESEREAVEAELAQERRHRARLRAQLQHLERRADYSRVLVRIETGTAEEPSGGGAWGVGDALDDAGQILAVAAAVTVVALAILGPIALIALLAWLAWLTHRAWVRRERRRVLS